MTQQNDTLNIKKYKLISIKELTLKMNSDPFIFANYVPAYSNVVFHDKKYLVEVTPAFHVAEQNLYTYMNYANVYGATIAVEPDIADSLINYDAIDYEKLQKKFSDGKKPTNSFFTYHHNGYIDYTKLAMGAIVFTAGFLFGFVFIKKKF
jgi:hypothetical protein